jgi:hypothetical protein
MRRNSASVKPVDFFLAMNGSPDPINYLIVG